MGNAQCIGMLSMCFMIVFIIVSIPASWIIDRYGIKISVGAGALLTGVFGMARWFPISERATASGLGTLAMYLGVLVGMLLTPYLVGIKGISAMLFDYGIVSVLAALIFILFSKERPKSPPCLAYQEERSLVYDGLKDTLKNTQFYWLLLIFFIGLGIFNSVTTWIEDILRPRGFSADQAGIAGGMMIVLTAICLLFTLKLKESPFMKKVQS